MSIFCSTVAIFVSQLPVDREKAKGKASLWNNFGCHLGLEAILKKKKKLPIVKYHTFGHSSDYFIRIQNFKTGLIKDFQKKKTIFFTYRGVKTT